MLKLVNIINGKKEKVRCHRLKLLRRNSYQITEDLLYNVADKQGELLVIDCFHEIRCGKGSVELFFKWKGFYYDEDDLVRLSKRARTCPCRRLI